MQYIVAHVPVQCIVVRFPVQCIVARVQVQYIVADPDPPYFALSGTVFSQGECNFKLKYKKNCEFRYRYLIVYFDFLHALLRHTKI